MFHRVVAMLIKTPATWVCDTLCAASATFRHFYRENEVKVDAIQSPTMTKMKP